MKHGSFVEGSRNSFLDQANGYEHDSGWIGWIVQLTHSQCETQSGVVRLMGLGGVCIFESRCLTALVGYCRLSIVKDLK